MDEANKIKAVEWYKKAEHDIEEKIFESIFEKAKVYCRDNTDLRHITVAWEMAKKLIHLEGGNKSIIIPAIILHDSGWYIFSEEEELRIRQVSGRLNDVKLKHKHEVESGLIADKILSEINYPKEEKRQIIEIIVGHGTRTSAISKEDMIVKDADRLSRYTPECFHLWCLKFKKDKEEFRKFLKEEIDIHLFTDSARFLAREYLLKMDLGLSNAEFESGISSKFYKFLIRLEGKISKKIRENLEKITIIATREKVYDVKRMIEIYLANRTYIDVKELQKDEKFYAIATQKVGEGGYIGVIDRKSGKIIFHPDRKVLNLSPEALKEKERPPEYLYRFWEWHERAGRGEEFYSYYQGMNIKGEVTDKFQYVIPLDINNEKWAIAVTADCKDFFSSIDILSKDIIQPIGEITGHIGNLAKLIEDRTNALVEANEQLQCEIIERKEAQRQLEEAQSKLIQAEKLSAMSQIASEAVHEIKNPLQVINTGLYYLKNIADREMQPTIQQMNKAVIRATDFINDLLNISRPVELKIERIDINELVKEAMGQIPSDVFSNIEIHQEFPGDLLQIDADFKRLEQVLVNLTKNAAEAMKEVKSKRLEVRSEREEGFIKISISDTGRGISKEEMDRIFDPFHTSKAKGVGLGLTICKRFIEAHQGSIEVESEIGVGTTFVIRLPCPPP